MNDELELLKRQLEDATANLTDLNRLATEICLDRDDKTQEIDELIAETETWDVSSQIKQKTEQIYQAVHDAVSCILATEQLLGLDNYAKIFDSADATCDPDTFLRDLKLAYLDFLSQARQLKSYEPTDQNIQTVTKLAYDYALISGIYENIDYILDNIVQEETKKQLATSDLTAQRNAVVEEYAKSLDETDKQFEEMLWLAQELSEQCTVLLCKGAQITEEPQLNGDFGGATLGIGVAEAQSQAVEFAHYGKSLSLPDENSVFATDLADYKHLWISYGAEHADDNRLWNALRCIALRFVLCYPKNAKQIILANNKRLSPNMNRLALDLGKCCTDGALFPATMREQGITDVSNIVQGDDDIARAVDFLLREVSNRQTDLNRENANNVFEYNASNPNKTMPLWLCILKDARMTDGVVDAEKVSDLLRICAQTGIFFLLLNDAETQRANVASLESEGCDKAVFDADLVFDGNSGTFVRDGRNLDCTLGAELLNDDYFAKIKMLTC